MIDATGMPQSAVLLGGTSEIGLEVLGALASRRLERVVLAGRDPAALGPAGERLERAGVREVHLVSCDVGRSDDLERLLGEAETALGSVDLLVVATGLLGTAELDRLTPAVVQEMFAANASGPAAATAGFAQRMASQGYGRIVVLSSVAGLRVRRANFVYGAGKAALDGFALGLADALAGTGVGVTIVRPGFVRTRMTAGMKPAPLSSEPADVARAVLGALEADRGVVYVPPALGPAFLLLRLLPRSVFRRLPG